MSRPRRTFRPGARALSLRERIMLLCLLALVAGYGASRLLETLDLTPRQDLAAEVARAEMQVRRQRLLLSREEQIHARYREIESPSTATADSALTETEVLRELSELSGRQVHVKSVVPRLGNHEGSPVMFVALDFEGPFDAVVGYVEKILDEMPTEISNLSLAPRADGAGGVVCRMSIRVGGFGTTTGT